MTGARNVKVAYGLDLAGYSKGKKSALARVAWHGGNEPVEAKVVTDHPFAQELKRCHKLAPRCEQQAIDCMLAQGRLFVDVPIDLQGLMGLDPRKESGDCDHQFVWELTLRPVDYAFGALPALADRIGSPVARFRNILSTLGIDPLGDGLSETYPAASLSLVGEFERCKNKKGHLTYKDGRAKREDGKWVPCGRREGQRAADTAVACIATEIGITTGTTITDDELDAVLCALTGVAPPSALLCGSALEKEISCRIEKKLNSKRRNTRTESPRQARRATAPLGYVLLRCKFWREIQLERVAWNPQENPR